MLEEVDVMAATQEGSWECQIRVWSLINLLLLVAQLTR
jgi:hypothetical protein